MAKFQLTSEKDPTGLASRIQAVVAIPALGVKAGDLGGFVQTVDNLSQTGNCWITRNARAIQNSRVTENGLADGCAILSGNVRLHGNGIADGYTVITDDAEIGGSGHATKNSRMQDRSRLLGGTLTDLASMHDDSLGNGFCYIGNSSRLLGRIVVSGKVGRDPLCITNLPMQANLYDTQMMIAGLLLTYAQWAAATTATLGAADSRLPAFWAAYRAAILGLAAADGRS